MDILASVVGSAMVETGKLFYDSIRSNIAAIIFFRSKCKDLEKDLNGLMSLKNEVDKQVESAYKDDKIPNAQVKEWLRKVVEMKQEAELVLQKTLTNNKKHLCECSLDCRNRFRLGKKVVKAIKSVKKLKQEVGNFPEVKFIDNPDQDKIQVIPGPSIQHPTASQNLVQLMEFLNDDEVQRIGVWGMGGIGKTTLVRTLNNKLRDSSSQPFSVVIWATVSKNFQLKRVQAQIAEGLNMAVKPEESDVGLAIRLHQRLGKEKKFLLILDDVWEAIDLDRLGVPEFEGNSSKVILTSRILDVFRGMKTDKTIKISRLNDDEAWQLFSQNAGEAASSEHIKPFAESVAQECGGLPLAIITMGKSMRGKKMVKLWKYALMKLQRSTPSAGDVEEKVYNILKWSYDTLDGSNVKSCFLFCCLFPEDYSIDLNELVNCWLAEGLIDEQRSYEELMISGIALLEKLKDSCLLEDGAWKGTVKMHDVVRDVAKWIASSSENGCKSIVQSGEGLEEIHEVKSLNSVRRVSFMNNKIKILPESVIECSEASTLLLQGNPLDTVPHGFLQGFRALRILNLSRTRIRALPVSLLQLKDIRVLLLKECFYLEELPSLEGLSRLEVLDLCATRIHKLPKGMKHLRQLQHLNLSRTHFLKSLPAGILSKLSSLQELDMTLSDYHWGVEGQAVKGEATFEELMNLQQLKVLCIRLKYIPSIGTVTDIPWIGRLRRFQFFIGEQANALETRHAKRRITISGLNLSEEWIGWLLINAKSLVMNHCWGLDEMLETLTIYSTSSFAGLKCLTISNSISSLRPAGGCAAHYDMLPNLEELYLDRLTYLESISGLVGYLGLWFSKLRVMEVTRCPRITHLLSYGNFILSLPSLEEIKVSFCDKLEELFRYSSADDLAPEPVAPSLKVLELKNLPKLKALCRDGKLSYQLQICLVNESSLVQVNVINCNLLRNLP